MADAGPGSATLTGASRWDVVPSPNWPNVLSPHAHTEPSDNNAEL